MKDILKNIIYKITYFMMNVVWLSPWGRAIIHKAVDLYLSSALFSERAKIFGKMEAAKMFSYREYKFFRDMAIRDILFLLSIFPNPYWSLRELEEKNYPHCTYMKV
jgi:hypothetical protein